MKILLLVCMFFCHTVYAKDVSRVSISAGSGDNPTKVQFIVTDSQGRKTGFKSIFTFPEGDTSVNIYKQIPKSNYYTNSIGSLNPSVVPDEPESAKFGMKGIIKDTYTIQFIGIDDCDYHFAINFKNAKGEYLTNLYGVYNNYITMGSTQQYSIYLDPTPGAPAPIIIKEVTFDVLRNNALVAQKLNQLGDDKFKDELIKIIDRAEKLSIKCDNKKKDKECGNKKASVNQLNLLIKRMEQTLKKDAKGKDKKNKKFITEEAFKIIKSDVEILIKDLGGKVKSKNKET